MHSLHTLLDHRQGAQTEQIDFQYPHPIQIFHIVLGGDIPVFGFIERNELSQFLRRDHQPRSMNRRVSSQSFQLSKHFDQLLIDRAFSLQFFQFRHFIRASASLTLS